MAVVFAARLASPLKLRVIYINKDQQESVGMSGFQIRIWLGLKIRVRVRVSVVIKVLRLNDTLLGHITHRVLITSRLKFTPRFYFTSLLVSAHSMPLPSSSVKSSEAGKQPNESPKLGKHSR